MSTTPELSLAERFVQNGDAAMGDMANSLVATFSAERDQPLNRQQLLAEATSHYLALHPDDIDAYARAHGCFNLLTFVGEIAAA